MNILDYRYYPIFIYNLQNPIPKKKNIVLINITICVSI